MAKTKPFHQQQLLLPQVLVLATIRNTHRFIAEKIKLTASLLSGEG
jgi:hypothetical protein